MSTAAAMLRQATAAGDVLVNERFVSLQGEGVSMGQAAVFIRLGCCNLDCAWCDTGRTWDWTRHSPQEQLGPMSTDELAEWALAQLPRLVVITGGEPLMQQAALLPLVRRLHTAGRRIEFETNGTLAPLAELAEITDLFTVSPKLSGSGVRTRRRISAEALAAFKATGKAAFKFVIAGPRDWGEAVELVEAHGLAPAWVMPEGTSPGRVLADTRELAELAGPRGWNVSFRLHVALGVR
jgi:7-carboxy-7-deazaguanine synthase